MDFGEQVIYDPIQAGSRPHPALIDKEQFNLAPLRWLQLQEGNEQATQVAWKIQSLLNQAHLQQLCLDGEIRKAICEDDIAVLSVATDNWTRFNMHWNTWEFRVNRPSKRSVFDSKIASGYRRFTHGLCCILMMKPSSKRLY